MATTTFLNEVGLLDSVGNFLNRERSDVSKHRFAIHPLSSAPDFREKPDRHGAGPFHGARPLSISYWRIHMLGPDSF